MTANTTAAKLIPRNKAHVAALLRLILPAMKAQVSVASVHGLRNCMECLGGVGYCENNEDGGLFNIAKIYRDNLVNPIWEGTVSVMAEDVVRVILDKRLGDGDVVANVFVPWTRNLLPTVLPMFGKEVGVIEHRVKILSALVGCALRDELLHRGRELLGHIDMIVSASVLLFDASVNHNTVVQEVVQRWIRLKSAADEKVLWTETARLDREIFLRAMVHGNSTSAAKL